VIAGYPADLFKRGVRRFVLRADFLFTAGLL
jgi:hypothetical protein